MNTLSDFSILFEKGIEVAPRIISHLDRNILSPSLGSFERRFWAWKMAAMPDASHQYALYYLALLWSLEEKENPFYQNERIVEWITSALSWWCIMQHRDGSFDQAFPHEHSVGATSYALLAVLETMKILGDRLSRPVRAQLPHFIQRSAKFLLKNQETYGIISNHLALFAVTFHELWKLTGEQVYKNKCKEQLALILEQMSPEGWFKEYEGADPGYMTQCMYYLAKLWLEGYQELADPIRLAIREYLPYFMHPDGSFGGFYGSRHTALSYPAAAALLVGHYPEAKKILLCLCTGIRTGHSAYPAMLDFPNAFRLSCNYFLAWEHLKKNKDAFRQDDDYQLPWEKEKIWKKFSEAGTFIVGTPAYYSILGFKQGGVLKIYNKKDKSIAFQSSGYVARIGRRAVSTQIHYNTALQEDDKRVKMSHPFFYVGLKSMSPVKYILVLIGGLTVFRFRIFREMFKRFLVRYLITGKTPTGAFYEREIVFDLGEVKIRDRIIPKPGQVLRDVWGGAEQTAIHMACANFFDFSCLASERKVNLDFIKTDKQVIEYTLDFSTNYRLNLDIRTETL